MKENATQTIEKMSLEGRQKMEEMNNYYQNIFMNNNRRMNEIINQYNIDINQLNAYMN